MPLQYLQFGIPSLDTMFGSKAPGSGVELGRGSTTISIAGPAGCGKSLLGLHLAAKYALDNPTALVLYVSTDMSHQRANAGWEAFGLGRMGTREVDPITKLKNRLFETDKKSGKAKAVEVRLRETPVCKLSQYIAEYLLTGSQNPTVHFLDLQKDTTGDDWLTLSRLAAVLCPHEGDGKGETLNLMVIDAIEGLVLMSGERDLFGEARSRRGRIAQLTRVLSDSFHVCTILEDPQRGHQLDEEFVADHVVRVGEQNAQGYKRRVIEVVKSRAQQPIRGEHALLIRGGTTGRRSEAYENPDDPLLGNAYMYVAYSVDARAAKIAEYKFESDDRFPSTGHCQFGITNLDNMLGDDQNIGLRSGRVTALIGDEGSHKSRLGRAFLANGLIEKGGAVLLTFDRVPEMEDRLDKHLIPSKGEPKPGPRRIPRDQDGFAEGLVYRRLEEQGTSAPVFMHIIDCTVLTGLLNILKRKEDELAAQTDKATESYAEEVKHLNQDRLRIKEFPFKRPSFAGELRVVLDDLSAMRQMYPDLEENHLFLGFLMNYFKLLGVTVLAIDTQSGRPGEIVREEIDKNLRAFVDSQIVTWQVQFGGETRLAITITSPLSSSRTAVVREVTGRMMTNGHRCTEALDVDRHFELYTRLEESEPELTPLTAYLEGDSVLSETYRKDVEWVLRCATGAFDSDNAKVRVEFTYESDRLLSMLHLSPPTLALRDTILIQVDDWWVNRSVKTEHATGRFLKFKTGKFTNRLRFDEEVIENNPQIMEGEGPSDLIPHYWNFGFLMLRERLWERAASSSRFKEELERFKGDGSNKTRGSALALISQIHEELSNHSKDTHTIQPPRVRHSWIEFLVACTYIGQYEGGSTSSDVTFPFEVDLSGVESLNTFVLEVWLSVLVHWRGGSDDSDAQELLSLLETSGIDGLLWQGEVEQESTVLTVSQLALYVTLLAISEAINVKGITSIDGGVDFAAVPAAWKAPAARHWYTTASMISNSFDPEDPWSPFQVPGYFSTRGDWYLAALGESRSEYLAEIAIEALSSHRGGRSRLQAGVGLPTVILADKEVRGLRTAIPRALEGRQSAVPYFDLKKIAPLGKGPREGRPFALWRSRIDAYDRMERACRRWFFRNLVAFDQVRDSMYKDWTWVETLQDLILENLPTEPSASLEAFARIPIDLAPIRKGSETLDKYRTLRDHFTPLLSLLRAELREIRGLKPLPKPEI